MQPLVIQSFFISCHFLDVQTFPSAPRSEKPSVYVVSLDRGFSNFATPGSSKTLHKFKQVSSGQRKVQFCTMFQDPIRLYGDSSENYPCNRPWRPIGLWDVEAPTFSRHSSHRWRWGCQPYAQAALYPQEDSWYSFMLEAESTSGP
jgi:hypothetical protein